MNAKTKEIASTPSEPENPAGVRFLPGFGPAKPKPAMREEAIAARLDEMQKAGIEDRQIAVESHVSRAAVDGWKNGSRPKEVTEALSAWLTKIDDEIVKLNGDFVMTPIAGRILRTFEQARTPKSNEGRRGVASIWGASGTGKSETAKWAARMDENVVYVQVDGECRTWTMLLKRVLAAKTGYAGYAGREEPLRERVVREVQGGGLIVFDHAHLLRLKIMEQLLVFPDEEGIALAFIGNTKGYKALMDAKLAQITSRIAGAQLFINMPDKDDVDALLEAWGISGRDERALCQQIGRQDGGLRYLDLTVREARKLALVGGARQIDVRHLKLGAMNAGCWIDVEGDA
jgi:DNA transposition AAA+ family ATPase